MAAQNYQNGGWYDNPSTGKNQRFMNGGFLPVGQTDPSPSNNGGVSSSGGGFKDPGTPRLDFVKDMSGKFLESDKAEKVKVDAARGSLVNYWSNREGATDRFGRIAGEQGLSEQQSLVDSLTRNVMTNQDLIDSIEPSVNERSGEFLINEGDRTAIVARERAPIEQNLTKLLRSKEYAEIGLQGKQALVSTLMQLSFQDDEMGAKPLQLNVDYTEDDRKVARDIFSSIMGAQVSAFSGDQDSRDAAQARAEAERMQREMNQISFGQSKELENLSSSNSLKNSLALKAASGGGGAATAPNNSAIYKGRTKEEIKQIALNT
ncbi:MAG: hypothetical protein M3Q07_12730, partial [Pseudobdellovibrionaceae bacterium]|nr:hypothetical protein [Pseudobdellovibrionaceae bacterium]